MHEQFPLRRVSDRKDPGMVRTIVKSTEQLKAEKAELLRQTTLTESELLRRGEQWITMSDSDWDIYYQVSDLNWLIADGRS